MPHNVQKHQQPLPFHSACLCIRRLPAPPGFFFNLAASVLLPASSSPPAAATASPALLLLVIVNFLLIFLRRQQRSHLLVSFLTCSSSQGAKRAEQLGAATGRFSAGSTQSAPRSTGLHQLDRRLHAATGFMGCCKQQQGVPGASSAGGSSSSRWRSSGRGRSRCRFT